MIITVTLNPAVDKTVEINNFEIGQVNRTLSVRMDAGGKGLNVSKVIKALGGESRALGILGGKAGEYIKSYMDDLDIENEFIYVNGESRTNLKIIDYMRKTNTDINETGPRITADDMMRLEGILFSGITPQDIIVFSGSIPPNMDHSIYQGWISRAKAMGVRTILDCDGFPLKKGLEAGPNMAKPNLFELENLFDRKINSPKAALELGRRLRDQHGIQLVVISMGGEGALFINKEQAALARPIKVEVKSTVGAGDAMVAALATCMDREDSFDKIVRLSMASATANVMTTGTQAAEYHVICELEKQVNYEIIT